ncbi:MAG TPA: cohesin domain-containing protein [Vicinamibacterales bacterium]|nr:cohesin domain-containing protein [Vicinamibacterales bacterium]
MHTFTRTALTTLALLALSSPALASAATLSLSPGTGSYAAGKQFTVKLTMDPGSDSVNAADGTVSFDPKVLSVVSVSKDASAFSLWTADPTFSNSDGTISFSGGSPKPISAPGTVLSITFKALSEGTGAVSVSKASVLAADGKGTDVYADGGTPGSYTVTAAAPDPAPDATDAAAADTGSDAISDTAVGPPPIAPVVSSPTHEKPDSWYATTTAVFTWKAPNDVLQIRTSFSQSDSDSPTQILKDSTSTQTVLATQDGTWYFAIQYKNDGGWGPVTHMKVNIDTVPPEEFTVALATSTDVPKLAFQTDDKLAGMDRYEILFGTTTIGNAKAADVSDGTWAIPPQAGGEEDVTVKAFDKAGNMRAATAHLKIPAVAKPADGTEPAKPATNSILEHIALVLLIIAFGVYMAWNMRGKTDAQLDRDRIVRHVSEMREKNDRIFTAMREEFEQLVNDLDPKPQLTVEERQMLESIKEVLDVSEGLIDQDIEQLKKEIRGK